MADRYWVGVDQNWHDGNNWSTTSGGAGGAGVPTASDDVYIDGNGYVLCWASTPFVCNNMSLLTGMTELFIFEQGGVINGDFLMQDGYFGGTGGGGYVCEFKGNYLNTGGSFSIGTGAGIDPTMEFSGTSKTYVHNNTVAASYQHLEVSGSYDFSGTRLSVANISQDLIVTGTLTIASGNRVQIDGVNADFPTLTGELAGQGTLYYIYKSSNDVPTGGTISIKYFRIYIDDATVTISPRSWGNTCTLEIEYNTTGQVFRLNSGRHIFGKLTIYGSLGTITSAEFDCDTNTAEMYLDGKFSVDNNAFPNATFTWKLGDGTHVFRGTIDLFFSYSSVVAQLVVDPGEGTIILYPKGLELIILPPPLRL